MAINLLFIVRRHIIMAIGQKIRKLDIFKKVPIDFSEGTNRGGLISILTVISIAFFLFVEFSNYLNPEYIAKLGSGQLVTRRQMKIHLDITLPNFPCQIISLDIQDIMMTHSPNLGSINKYRLDREGNPIDGDKNFQLLRQNNQEQQYQMAKDAFQKRLGCRLQGDFTVKQVPGNFHISSHAYQNIYARLRIQNVINNLDMTHHINYIFFGDMHNVTNIQKKHPEAVLAKLNNHKQVFNLKSTAMSFISHYHIDIVPTIYYDSVWGETRAYQYTYNHNRFQIHQMPSIYFNYNIDGHAVHIFPSSPTLSGFLIKLCAIIGGTFTIASFLDNALDTLINDRSKQYELVN